MADKMIVQDVSKDFAALDDGMEKGYVLGVMQGILLSREKESSEPREQRPSDKQRAG